jgi:flagellar biosynthesis/type III secretory pathway protein FliH
MIFTLVKEGKMTQEEFEKYLSAVYDDGYSDGYDEGYGDGKADGHTDGYEEGYDEWDF